MMATMTEARPTPRAMRSGWPRPPPVPPGFAFEFVGVGEDVGGMGGVVVVVEVIRGLGLKGMWPDEGMSLRWRRC
jgi:hypothetical protein